MRMTINGRAIETEEGATILQVAQKNGIRIPTLCHMESLIPTGSCRMCVVEIQGLENPVTACNTQAMDGMVIETDTPKIRELRKEVLQFFLVKHPLDCPVCDKGGECDLQDYVYEYGIQKAEYQVEALAKEYKTYSTPAIKYHPNRCILCSRCIRTCREIVGREVLDLKETGFDTRVEAVRPERCISCGECLAACPVGALTENISSIKGRVWQAKRVSTICGYCGVGCSLEVNVVGNRLIKVTTKEGLGTNNGVLCVKGRFGYEFVNSPERLRTPLIRDNGKLREASWDEAMTYVSTKLREIKEKNGPDSIAGLASARVTCEENYLFQKFIRAAIGTNNIDHCARL
ncbi:MAG: 2Fe-2S iron-sulfur cluster-binding protein [Deltaproteobacteria bacterium]|nr:2Fe-2S iron-sulfur cluster-binding protein [Deltaproteobacteria bacterium]